MPETSVTPTMPDIFLSTEKPPSISLHVSTAAEQRSLPTSTQQLPPLSIIPPPPPPPPPPSTLVSPQTSGGSGGEGRSDLMAAIRAAGGISGAKLRPVKF